MQPALDRRLIFLLAATCGITVANIYLNQPLLVQMGHTFRLAGHQGGWIATLTQVGVALGMFLFVPLGDMLERKRLIVAVVAAEAGLDAAVAISPSFAWLGAASFLLGVGSIAPHLVAPFAAHLAAPEKRGQVVGSVMSGLLIGILLARTLSGWLGEVWGWRAVYWAAAAVLALLALVLSRALPRSRPEHALSYGALLASLPHLLFRYGPLREAAFSGAMLFGAFCAFWTALTFLLAGPPFHYGSTAPGLFGLVGLVGAGIAPLVGALTDRRPPRFAVGIGIALTLAAFVCFWFGQRALAGLIGGVVLLDAGIQAGHLANLIRIYRLPSHLRSRLNMIYMVAYFAGGAAGSALSVAAWSRMGWRGVCGIGLGMPFLALLYHARPRPPAPKAD